MTRSDPFDRRVSEAIDDLVDARVPDYKNDVLARTSRMRQRPVWTFPERWLPMTTITWPTEGRRLRPSWLFLTLATLLVALAASGLLIASSFLRADAPPIPAPAVGPAANGLIAFDHAWDIWVVEPDGTRPRALVRDAEYSIDPTWSPDGTRLAYWAVVPPEGTEDIVAGTASLIVVGSDGGGRTVIVEGVGIDPLAAPPSWSPDGDELVYAFEPDPGSSPSSIAIVASTGGTPRVLVERGMTPTWSPDGRSIAYKGMDAAGKAGIHVLDLTTGNDVRVSTGTGAFGGHDLALAQWSPDSTELAYFSGPTNPDIRIAKADGSGDIAVIETSEAGGMDTRDVWPAWLPDGARIVYLSTTHSPSGWVVANKDGTHRIPLLGTAMSWTYPTTVSPDGTRLVAFDQRKKVQLVDLTGTVEPVEVDAVSTFLSSSWQRLAP